MKIKDIVLESKTVKVEPTKPRNFVAKNAMKVTSGAGAHRDKKKEQKQGEVKHKAKQYDEDAAGVGIVTKQNATVDVPVGGEYMNVKKLFPKKKKVKEQGVAEYGDTAKGQKMLTKVHKRAVDRMIKADDKRDAKSAKKNQQTANRAWDRFGEKEKYGEDINMERVRDPEDWDEGNTEPPNNFAVYINGKKWKVFQGRGRFADDYKEREHYRQLQNWAQAKSQATGKKWEVYITGEPATA